jgi:Fe2+ transport system protein FeoA
MEKNEIKIKKGDTIKILGFDCGKKAISKYNAMNIKTDSIIKIKSVHPIEGPIVVEVGQSTYSIGRGMFYKLIYEKIDEMS